MSDRYISEKALIENIVKIKDLRTLSTKTIGDAISMTPTADVVEVVRCKDCKHFYLDERCTLLGDFPEEPQMEPDDFCSYGEKKTEGGEKMGSEQFTALVKKTVMEYANAHLDKTDGKHITEDDVFIVWQCKTLQNNKALASTTLFDGMYYELTYNGDKQECYVDAYKKWENFCIKV